MSDAPKVQRYRGKDIEITYDTTLCIHAGECVRGLPAVFDTQRQPWVSPDGAEVDAVAKVIAKCPSGALKFTKKS